MPEIILNDFKKRFLNLVKNSNEKIVLCSPVIKDNVLEEVLKNIKNDTSVEVITSSILSNFMVGASDVAAIEKLISKGIEVKNFQKLNNQLYFFDDKVLLTSANLNISSFNNKFEYGILFNSNEDISYIKEQYDEMIKSDSYGKITSAEVATIKKYYKKLNSKSKYIYDESGDLILHTFNIEHISKGVTASWQKNMILFLNGKIMKDVFYLDDVYKEKDFFQTLYPTSNTIDARIRRTLQELRDIGLIKFYGNGKYKKLWKIDN